MDGNGHNSDRGQVTGSAVSPADPTLANPALADAMHVRVQDEALMSPFRRRIHFHGLVSDMPAFYSSMDLVVFPSSHESFGNVLAEALINGLLGRSHLPAERFDPRACLVIVEQRRARARGDARERQSGQDRA